jgi:F420-dependent oxidoreductase-like protein
MDHFIQIPVVGREWEDMFESYTTLGYLAAITSRIKLGTLVTGITYRNIAHLGKIVATLDVLSGGRAWCGLGAAWFDREHQLYGWRFPSVAERYAALRDALELLPLMWGPGSPAFEGRTISVPAATCYPRPIQEHVPILVGGSGEKTTLRLVARYADACNLFANAGLDTLRHKLEVLREHCRNEGRDYDAIEKTVNTRLLLGDGSPPAQFVEECRRLQALGVTWVNCGIPNAHEDGVLELIGREIVPAIADL